MINVDMRQYDYFTLGNNNAYGQPQISAEVQGTLNMAIYTTNQSIQNNINYSGATYIGLTTAAISDKFVIKYDEATKLKVLYIQPKGRYKQVYLSKI